MKITKKLLLKLAANAADGGTICDLLNTAEIAALGNTPWEKFESTLEQISTLNESDSAQSIFWQAAQYAASANHGLEEYPDLMELMSSGADGDTPAEAAADYASLQDYSIWIDPSLTGVDSLDEADQSALILKIEEALDEKIGGTWSVEASGSECSPDFGGLSEDSIDAANAIVSNTLENFDGWN